MKNLVRIVLIVGALLALAAAYLFYRFQTQTAVPDELEDPIVYIPSNSDFEEVVRILKGQDILQDELIFRRLSEYMKYKRDTMRAGRFRIDPGTGLVNLIRHLRNGPQAPVRVVLNNERFPEEVAAKVAGVLESDSAAFMQHFSDPIVMEKLGYSTDTTLMSLFIPNTYEFLWNTGPKGFLQRMLREHDKFWDRNDRREKAEALGLTPTEVYTLASIIQKETLRDEEKPVMAGVYLNRLEEGIPLQADPTAVFARRDFETPRVTNYHIKFDSPYNTYMYRGLPPGPIAMASISSIDAVLNFENHDYLYFCALGDGSGRHAFARTLAEHNRNANRYRENLRRRGLR